MAEAVLTEIRPTDSDAMFGWVNDRATMVFSAPYRPTSRASHNAWFDGLGKNPGVVNFAIRETHAGEILGTVNLIDIHHVHRTAELTIKIGVKTDRKKGLGTSAIKQVVDFAFKDLNLQRVWLRVFTTNTGAIKAYANAGFSNEGTMRRAVWINGEFLDEHVMAVLKEI
jgi:RimJ/RimL family protein N-acetyltransferase